MYLAIKEAELSRSQPSRLKCAALTGLFNSNFHFIQGNMPGSRVFLNASVCVLKREGEGKASKEDGKLLMDI